MGTKVESKGHLSGYFVMGDLNVSSNSSWPQYYEERTQNGHLYNDFVLRPMHGYLVYDKEILKRTMLEQDAVFRKQVHELHRLYRIQKDLMEQFHKNATFGHLMEQSYSFSSHVASEGTKRIWQIPHQNNMQQFPALGHVGIKSSNFLREGSAQSFPIFSKKMLDLQLPADVYIENKDADGTRNTADSSCKPLDPLAITDGPNIQNDELTLGTNDDAKYKEGNWISADLNEPIADIFDEGVSSASACIDFVGVKNYTIQNQWHRSSTRSVLNFLGLSREAFKDQDAHEGTGSILFGANEKEIRQNSFGLNESRKGTRNMNFYPSQFYDHGSFQPVDRKLKKTADTLLPDQNNTLTWFGQNPIDAVESSGRNHYTSCSHSWLAVLPTASSFTDHHLENSSAAASPLVLPWLNTRNGSNHVPAAPQAPSGNESASNLHEKTCDLASENTTTDGHKWKNNRVPYLNGCHSSASPSSDINSGHNSFKYSMDVNVIQESPDKTQNCVTVLDDRAVNETVHKCEESSAGISWFKKGGDVLVDLNRSEMTLGSTESHSWMIGNSNVLTKESESRTEKALSLPSSNMQVLVEKTSAPIRNFIDLNDAVLCMENNPKSSEVSSGEMGISVKPVPSIDLKAPVLPQDSVFSAELDGLLEKECSADSSVIAAAENIVAMSMNPCSSMEDVLLWFAEVVTSNAENLSDDKMDVFESMTLKLEETKIEENWHRPKAAEHKSGEDISAPSLVLTRPRRGQGRQRRQRRDFQKDILPGLASLSRIEVTEDLQALGGLMKASGTAWQSASMRRARCNGSQAKGRRQPRSLAVAVAEIRHVNPPPQPAAAATAAEVVGADGRGMIAWGRTTRRCRRQRCLLGNASVHLA